MRSVARIERKRILNKQILIVISILIVGFSIASGIFRLKSYDIYDSTGNVEMSGWDNIKDSRKKEHRMLLDEKALKDIVDRKDKSKYIYNSSNVRIANSVYRDKKLSELTNDDIKNFYTNRSKLVSDIIKHSEVKQGGLNDSELNYLAKSSNNVKTPIETGYAEGWRNLNNDMAGFIPLILGLISILILPVFAEDSKVKMKEFYASTVNGKKVLVNARLIAGVQVGVIVYTLSMIVLTLSRLLILGFQGGSLPIQGSVKFFFSVRSVTYFQQYLLNFTIGFVAMLFIVSVVMLFAVLTQQIVAAGVLLAFFWIIMTMVPPLDMINRYFMDFLPYKMTNFNTYYIDNEVYSIFGEVFNKSTMVILISIILLGVFILASFIISNRKLKASLN